MAILAVEIPVIPDIPDLNLNRLRDRARERKSWANDRIEKAIVQYQRFLQVCKAYPDQKVCPSEDGDEIWHLHILDTENYARDCDAYFGHFLHHDPCLGEPDYTSMENTVVLFGELFGDSIEPTDTCAGPGGGCGSIMLKDGAVITATCAGPGGGCGSVKWEGSGVFPI